MRTRKEMVDKIYHNGEDVVCSQCFHAAVLEILLDIRDLLKGDTEGRV